MATIGLKDLFGSLITVGQDGTETYGEPFRIAKAITADLSVESAEGRLDADDQVDEYVKEFVSAELTLNINDLTPEITSKLLGQTLDADNVVYADGKDDAPYYAVSFSARKPGGKYKYIWFYKVKFGTPNETYNTKTDGIEFTTPEIVGKVIARPDGKWKAEYVGVPTDAVASAWYTAVREPKEASESEEA